MIEDRKEILFTDDSWWCGVLGNIRKKRGLKYIQNTSREYQI
jgi:hypothetical protein